jgi:hypothetical protein
MYSPVYLFDDILPQELLNKVQQYLSVNNEIKNALKKYYNELYDQRLLDEEEIFENKIYPNCSCSNCPENGIYKIFRRRDCSFCFEYEIKQCCEEYTSKEYKLVIRDNPQYKKIAYDDYDSDDSIDDMFWYDDRHIWIENNDYQMLEN